MVLQKVRGARTPLLAAAAVACGFLLVGCDEYVHITRDRDVHISKHATWAWRPLEEKAEQGLRDRDSRPVTSRDVIGRGGRPETVREDREDNAQNDLLRDKVKNAIDHDLTQKGLRQVSDSNAADILVDFHIAVQRRNVRVGYVYPGGYPGLVCGPFGCYEGWGWGPPGVSYENIRFREGTIVLDIVQQSARNHLVYRATGEKPVHRDSFSFSQGEVNGIVHKLLDQLRPGK
jgi:uncharacterized protein DUF4136